MRVRGTICSNFGEALKQAALLGHGISMHPTYMVSDDLKAGRLAMVLPDYEPLGLDIYVVYPTREHLPARTRRFLEFLTPVGNRTPPDWAVPLSAVSRCLPTMAQHPAIPAGCPRP